MIEVVHRIEKKHVAAMVVYAVRHIPECDEATLHRYLELINLTGSMGWISDEQLVEKMRFMMKHVPGTCRHSLLTLVELLAVYLPIAVHGVDGPVITLAEPHGLPEPTTARSNGRRFFSEKAGIVTK